MSIQVKVEHLHDKGILHTWFEAGSTVDCIDDVRRFRDRLLHALLEWPTPPHWVVCVDDLFISDLWRDAWKEAVEAIACAPVKTLVRYTFTHPTRDSEDSSDRLETLFVIDSNGADLLFRSKEEAFAHALSFAASRASSS